MLNLVLPYSVHAYSSTTLSTNRNYKFKNYFESVGRKYDDAWLDMDDEPLWALGKVVESVNKQKQQYNVSEMQLMSNARRGIQPD